MKVEELIEEEAVRRATSKHSSEVFQECTIKDFQAGAHFALSQFKWRKVEEELPEENKPYLCRKRYDYERNGKKGCYHQTQILIFNQYHNCWDQEDGDDYDCDINQVSHWAPIPEVE